VCPRTGPDAVEKKEILVSSVTQLSAAATEYKVLRKTHEYTRD